MLFPPVFLFSSYINVAGYKTDSAGTTAAFSALYVLLAMRRKVPISRKFGVRGFVRAGAMGLGVANVAGCGLAYAFGDREREAEERRAKTGAT
jgi:hypothetical protein